MPVAEPLSRSVHLSARLPLNADDGFPQAVRFTALRRTYRIGLYVAIPEQSLPPRGADPRTRIDVLGRGDGSPSGLLIADIAAEQDGVDVVLLHRRLLPGLSYRFADLRLEVRDAVVAVGNLNGVGAFGSVLELRVGAA